MPIKIAWDEMLKVYLRFENWKVYIDLVSNSESNYSASLCIINNCSLFLPPLGPAAWMSISDVKKNHVQLFLFFFSQIFQGKSL